MAKFIDENITEYITYEQFIQWLKEGSEMEFLYEDTSIKINYVTVNKKPTFLLTEKNINTTVVNKYISRHQIVAHEFSNGKTLQEMWDSIKILEIF